MQAGGQTGARHEVEAVPRESTRWSPPPGPAPGRRSPPSCRGRTSKIMAGTSPPGPHKCGSTTCNVKDVAMAASKALPPRWRTPMPTAEPIQCVEVTTPKVPSICGRVVKRFADR